MTTDPCLAVDGGWHCTLPTGHPEEKHGASLRPGGPIVHYWPASGGASAGPAPVLVELDRADAAAALAKAVERALVFMRPGNVTNQLEQALADYRRSVTS